MRELNYTGQVYRPPMEAETLLLQVTVGCSYNQCSFCAMYNETPFSVEREEDLIKNLEIARSHGISYKRIFMVNGDAFVLSPRRLRRIAELGREYLPGVKTLASYASIGNIISKSIEDLADLRVNYGYNELYVGLESGHDQSLEILKANYTKSQALEAIKKLEEAGYDYTLFFIMGALGKGREKEAAAANANLLSQVNPSAIWIGSLRSYPGTGMQDMIQKGDFIQSTELEIIEEMRDFVRLIENQGLQIFAQYPMNTFRFSGILPRDKKAIFQAMDEYIREIGPENLDFVASRIVI